MSCKTIVEQVAVIALVTPYDKIQCCHTSLCIRGILKLLKKERCVVESASNIGLCFPTRSNCVLPPPPPPPHYIILHNADFAVNKNPFLHIAILFTAISWIILYYDLLTASSFCQQHVCWSGVTPHTPLPRDGPEPHLDWLNSDQRLIILLYWIF